MGLKHEYRKIVASFCGNGYICSPDGVRACPFYGHHSKDGNCYGWYARNLDEETRLRFAKVIQTHPEFIKKR